MLHEIILGVLSLANMFAGYHTYRGRREVQAARQEVQGQRTELRGAIDQMNVAIARLPVTRARKGTP